MFLNGVEMAPDEFDAALAEVHVAMAEEERSIAATYGCSDECASAISYLRSRSRWSEAKEAHLVALDRTGEPLPDVYSGEF